jgi:hypothetical protein
VRGRHDRIDIKTPWGNGSMPGLGHRLIGVLLHREFWSWGSTHWQRFVALGGFFLVAAPIAGWYLGSVANAIYWATGGILLIYTIETQAMRLEMVRQNELAIRPLLITTIEERVETQQRTPRPHLLLRNIGRGAALFVRMQDLELEFEPGKRDTIQFDHISYIEPGKDASPLLIFSSPGEGNRSRTFFPFAKNLDPQAAIITYKVAVSYEDIFGQEYQSIMQMGKDGIRLLKP